jgi:DNA helicase-2/ATP-dependent DNA helicase PcrA
MHLSKDKLRLKFDEEYNKLNEKQREAVDRIDGPVMVIAGPGTGKTQILASRIGKILLETDVNPDNILCLTYTDAGAIAMRKRLLHFIGPEAYKVNISTFHSFCHEVIQENLHLFEKTTLEPISELESVALFKELIDGFPKNHPLKRYRGDVYFERDALSSLFSIMKKEGWKAEFLIEKIDAYIADLPTREEYRYKRKYKEFQAGDLKQAQYEEEVEKMNKLSAAVHEFDRFQEMMRRRNRYDFDDMINWVIKAFEENPNLLARYQEKYQYMLVDEYQDTSGTQNRIVELLTSYWEQPNIFVVGDDDQSIYRFQGANMENMHGISDRFKEDLLKVILPLNYRSTQPILDLAGQLIGYNTERLIHRFPELQKELVAAKEVMRTVTHLPESREYDTQHQEMIGITESVLQLLGQGILPGRIAVLYKENKYGEELATYFRLKKIPAYSRKNLDLLKLSLPRKALLIMKYLDAEWDVPFSGDEMLFEILHFDWFRIPALQIAELASEAADRRRGENVRSLRQLLAEKIAAPHKDLFTPSISEGLKRAGTFLENMIAAVSDLPLQQLFESIIREGGAMSAILESPDKTWQLQVLTRLFDFIKEDTRRNPDLTLHQFVLLIDLMEKEDVSIPMVQVAGSEKGVNLLTVHGSKGLEFEYVFLAGCNAASWESKSRPNKGFKLPDNIFSSLSLSGEEEELRRLFYVAVTRAENHLILSHARYRDDGKELEPSRFLAEVSGNGKSKLHKITVDEDVLAAYRTLQFVGSGGPEIERAEADFIDRALDKFEMNVTALNNFLRCPLEFYYNNIIRIPSAKNEAMEFGTAVHDALQRLFEKMKREKAFPPVTEFIGYFETHLYRHRESFTKEQYERRLEYGRDILSNYYHTHIDGFHRNVDLEVFFTKVVVDGVPLRGKLDKIEKHGHSVNVVDYKTGKPENADAKLKGPSDKVPHGGDYWRQAVFYKLLVDHSPRGMTVDSTEFDFVEPDNAKQYRRRKLTITPADETTVRQQVRTAWDRIQAKDFFTGCGKPDCHWCNFVRDHKLTINIDPDLGSEEQWKDDPTDPPIR